MLMLSRRIGESLVIGHEVTLTVLGIKGTQVRLGIKAPRDIPVHREEIWERILKEQADGEHVEAVFDIDLDLEMNAEPSVSEVMPETVNPLHSED